MKIKRTYIFLGLAFVLFLSANRANKIHWDVKGYLLEEVAAPVRVVSIDNPALTRDKVSVWSEYLSGDSISVFFNLANNLKNDKKLSPPVHLGNDTLYVHRSDLADMHPGIEAIALRGHLFVWLNGKQEKVILNGKEIWRNK